MNAQYNATAASSRERGLFEKIRMLSPDRLAEVQDFVEFLSQRDRDARLRRAGNRLSEEAFKKVWDNPEDAEYDNLQFRRYRPGSVPFSHLCGVI